jgi:hypothetical protein
MQKKFSPGCTAGRGRLKLQEIGGSLSEDHRPRLSDLISKSAGKLRPIVWVGIGLATFQQLVGINVVFYYGAVLCRPWVSLKTMHCSSTCCPARSVSAPAW